MRKPSVEREILSGFVKNLLPKKKKHPRETRTVNISLLRL
jgi:hypothetical protein